MQYLSPKILLSAYKRGLFPMAETREDTDLFWVDPQFRGVLPINDFHISRSLRRRILKKNYEVTISTAFDEVVAACAERQETWINKTIFELYCALAKEKHAHSIEIWQDRHLVGGVYGVVIGAAFFGESMFSRRTDASKIALAYLVHRLHNTGFKLFDTQFITPHLASLGAIELPRSIYLKYLSEAINLTADFTNPAYSVTSEDIVHLNTHTSYRA